jgi:hypothetical protein
VVPGKLLIVGYQFVRKAPGFENLLNQGCFVLPVEGNNPGHGFGKNSERSTIIKKI